MGHKPPVYLRPGDLVEYGIDGLGEAHQRVVAAPQV
jgi:2-keto-4-pentenoate hydratase/2-oxohepta-3-ene-1,7-dioic acid hydratase in catechol pathway